MELKVYVQAIAGKVRCVCLQSNKRCKRPCEKQRMTYDQYQDLKECMRNEGNKNYTHVE